jgi:hypothetical protein
MQLNTAEKTVLILSTFYLVMACIFTSLSFTLAGYYILFYGFWLVTLYVSYFIVKTLYPSSLQWDGVIWIAILVVATYVIICITFQILIWTGVDLWGKCGPGMKC